MPKADSKLLMPYYKRQEKKQLRQDADRPEAGEKTWAGSGAGLGGALGALIGASQGGWKPKPMGIGGGAGALGVGLLGYLIASANNKSRGRAQGILKQPRRKLNQYLQDTATKRYLGDLYGIESAGAPSKLRYNINL